MSIDNEDWLSKTPEDALEPDLKICDAHHHLWDHPDSRYMADDLAKDVAQHNVVSTVFVECTSDYYPSGPEEMKPVGETVFVEKIAAECAAAPERYPNVAAAIVSFADLQLGEAVKPVLEAHMAASPNRFRGIRHACGWDESPDVRNSHTKPPQHLWTLPDFREGFDCMGKLGLSFDAWLYFTQLSELAGLAQAFPDTPIIMNHVAGPLGIGPYANRRDEIFETWRKGVAEVAASENVVVKLGGLAMPICGNGWHKRDVPPGSEEIAEAMAPYYLYCIELFGPDRCMFESNFPVDKQSCSYTVLWNAFKRIVSDFSASEKESLFHDTAARVYELV